MNLDPGGVLFDVSTAPTPITVYWRPGCAYCRRLRSYIRRAGISADEVNIWEDPQAAAFVRSVAGGNETVPTVTVGGRSIVNPSPRQLAAALRQLDPALVPAEGPGRGGPLAAAWRRWVLGR